MLRNRQQPRSQPVVSEPNEDEQEQGDLHTVESVLFTMVSQAERMEDPQTLQQALDSDESEEWIRAMDEEMDSLAKNGTWDKVPRPPHKNVIRNKWVYRKKLV